MRDLQPLLEPKGIVILGASEDQSTLRGMLTATLISHRYAHEIYLVTRSHNQVFGHDTYASIDELPAVPDLAIVLVPAAHVVTAIEQSGARGVRAAVIISSGFGEEKTAQATDRNEALRAAAERHRMLICGPNSEGFVNPQCQLAATFSPVFGDPRRSFLPPNSKAKRIAVSCQSGALTFAFFSRARARQLRFVHQISAGNQMMLEAHDYFDWLIEQDQADILLAYLENIGDPAAFRALADKALRAGKPLIVAKVGRSAAGRRAAASHTGAIAQSGAVDDAVFRHHGIIRGEDPDQVIDIAAAFAFCKPPRGRRVAIITGSGGSAVWLSDILSEHGLELPELEEDVQRELIALLPSYASAQNPIDATAQAIISVGYARLVDIVSRSARIDMILLIASLANEAHAAHHAASLEGVANRISQSLMLCTYTTATPEAIGSFAEVGIPCYLSMSSCARSLQALAYYSERRARAALQIEAPPIGASIREQVADTLAGAGKALTEFDAKALLAQYGVPRPREDLVRSLKDALLAAGKIGGPVALKVQSVDIAHKTDVGAVALGLQDDTAIRAAYERILANARATRPDAMIQGVLVQAMAPAGLEFIIGVTRNATFGLVLMVGLGGIHVEVLKDVAFAPVPLSRADAASLLLQLRGAALLEGVRGAPPADREALVELIVAVARFAADQDATVQELELNPVIVHPIGKGLTVVDALIVTRNHLRRQ
jgi:acyl-CoA synthetase (NDP forming)